MTNVKLQIAKAVAAAVFFLFSASAANTQGQAVLKIGGTGGALAPIKEAAAAFQKKHPGVKVIVPPSLGSNGGIKALLSGALDIAVSSRPLNANERAHGAIQTEYGRSAFVFVTSQGGPPSDLTVEKLFAIYSGDKKTWEDGTPVRLILRPATDTDNVYLKGMSRVMDKAVQIALSKEGMITAVTDQDNLDTIEHLKGGFGASTLSQVIAEHRRVTVFRWNGVAPSVATVRDGTYPYYKCYFAITRANPGRTVRSFIDFLYSQEGRAILKRTGHLTDLNAPCSSPTCTEEGAKH